jgi:hypothetical protein
MSKHATYTQCPRNGVRTKGLEVLDIGHVSFALGISPSSFDVIELLVERAPPAKPSHALRTVKSLDLATKFNYIKTEEEVLIEQQQWERPSSTR